MRPADLAAALTAPPVRPLLVIAAHPDDEVIGAAGRLGPFQRALSMAGYDHQEKIRKSLRNQQGYAY
jgi:hypothetical protein